MYPTTRNIIWTTFVDETSPLQLSFLTMVSNNNDLPTLFLLPAWV